MMKVSALALALSSAASVAFAQSLSSPQGWTPAPNKLPPADISWQLADTILCNATGILGPITACPLDSTMSFLGGALHSNGSSPPFGQVVLYTAATALTAGPQSGGCPGSATVMGATINVYTTVATAGNCGLLPPAATGLFQVACDPTNLPMTIWPNGTDAINGLGSSISVVLPAHSCSQYWGTGASKWGTYAPSTVPQSAWVNAPNVGQTAIASTSAQMAGLGVAAQPTVITPATTGRVNVSITTSFSISTAVASCNFQIAYGTGTPPSNGATAVGTVIGKAQTLRAAGVAGNWNVAIAANVTGLTVGTAYWFDLQIYEGTSGDTCTLNPSNTQLNEG
jgi:hypothetical protein